MMRILVVYAHPLDNSFCSALRRTVLTSLAKAGHDTRDVDLYADNFQPALSAQERAGYYDDNVDKLARSRYIDDLLWCEGLVFVYPSWWFSLPAILKGWIDRVWVPGVAFELRTDKPGIRRKLGHIRLFAAVTTYGSPWWVIKWAGDPGKKLMLNGLRVLCHPRCTTHWLALYKMDTIHQAERARFLAKVAQVCSRIR